MTFLLKLKSRSLKCETPTGDDGEPCHGLLEKILKLAITVTHQQLVFG